MKISIDKACDLLRGGKVVAVPTETVYGLAASLSNPAAIEEIFRLKQRPQDNPLIIHVGAWEKVIPLVLDIPKGAKELAEVFWPGPLTLIFEANPETVSAVVCANLSTVAIRMPNHSLALQVLKKTGPLVAPSANLSGKPSSTCREHIEHDFGDNFPVLDGGACSQGMESTIVIFREEKWWIAREGSLSQEELAKVLGYSPPLASTFKMCPGKKHRHYAPCAKLVLSEEPYNGSIPVVLGFSDRSYEGAKQVFSLGTSTSPEEIASHLYATLRSIDEQGVERVWVDLSMPQSGLYSTIRERLTRAAMGCDF